MRTTGTVRPTADITRRPTAGHPFASRLAVRGGRTAPSSARVTCQASTSAAGLSRSAPSRPIRMAALAPGPERRLATSRFDRHRGSGQALIGAHMALRPPPSPFSRLVDEEGQRSRSYDTVGALCVSIAYVDLGEAVPAVHPPTVAVSPLHIAVVHPGRHSIDVPSSFEASLRIAHASVARVRIEVQATAIALVAPHAAPELASPRVHSPASGAAAIGVCTRLTRVVVDPRTRRGFARRSGLPARQGDRCPGEDEDEQTHGETAHHETSVGLRCKESGRR